MCSSGPHSFSPMAKLIPLKVVPLESAHIASEWASSWALDDSNHLSICKFGGFDDPKYQLFKSALERFLEIIAKEPVAGLNDQSILP
jgi:hypothetical protein